MKTIIKHILKKNVGCNGMHRALTSHRLRPTFDFIQANLNDRSLIETVDKVLLMIK